MIAIHSFLTTCFLAVAVQHLSINQSSETLDGDVKIRIEQLQPFQTIELEAKSRDLKDEVWSSRAFFQADKLGFIDVNNQLPLPGSSYDTVDGMGLSWSMLPLSKDPGSSFKTKDDDFTIEFTLYQDGKPTENEIVHLYLKKPKVQRIEIHENGIVGVLFLPPSDGPLPVIITLSGSNGGLSESRAKLLASNGFATLALGYFGAEGLPSNLQDIPLEYFETVFSWLKTQPCIDSSRVGLYGVSRGAELSLILGSIFPDSIHAIAAIVPSSVIYGGLGETPVNAWTYKGKPILPFAPVPKADFSNGKGKTLENPANTRDVFLEGMKDEDAYANAAIPVENIQCPILLVSGGNDQMWPSDIYSQQILDRLDSKHSSILRSHLNYPCAGHGITIPNLPFPEPTYYHPIGKLWFSMGGTRDADAKASLDSWKKITAFFHKTFKSVKQPR